jgi:hypothetical protein
MGRPKQGLKPGARIPVELCSSRSRRRGIDFSVKEKDEASALNCFRRGRNDFAFILVLPGDEGVLFLQAISFLSGAGL